MFSNIFPKFQETYPDVKINLFEGTVWAIMEMIATGKVDIGFLTSGLTHPAVVSRQLAMENIVLVVPRSHPLAHLAEDAPNGHLATVDLRLFKNDKFLLPSEGTTLRIMANQAFQTAGFEPQIAFETSSVPALHNLATSGYGIAFVPLFYTNNADKVVSFYTDPPINWNLIATYRKGSYITKAEEYMITLAEQYYKEILMRKSHV